MEFRLRAQMMVAAGIVAVASVWAADGPTPAASAIKQFPLDERTVYQIAIGCDVPTTIMFPSALTAIEGANVTTAADSPAPVILAYTPGQHFFSVRALEAEARGAVNIVWRQRTFVIRFQESMQPYGSVTFYEETFTGRGRQAQKRVSPDALLALLDRVKSFGLIALQYPEVVQQVEHTAPDTISYYRNFRVIIEEVFRFDPEDTLVFKLRFENEGEREIRYLPQRLAARVGLNVYYPSIVDASGIVPPGATTTAYFAVTGSPTGGRANLSVKNRFSIVVTRIERDAKLIVPE